MIRKSIATAIKTGAVAFLLFALLLADGFWKTSVGFLGSFLREITAVFRDPGTQWMVFLCLVVYFTIFLFLRARIATGLLRAANPSLWLALGLFIGAIFYAFNYSPSLDALTLLAGAVLGQGVAIWTGFEIRNPQSAIRNSFGVLILSLLVILLALASIWNVNSGHSFEYRSHARWSGPWDSPNIFGLLMGTGMALTAGGAVSCVMCRMSGKAEVGSWKLEVGECAVIILCFVAAMLMARGLLHSYSRGAWLATFCGLGWFAFQVIKDSYFQQIRTVCWICTNKINLVVIICAIAVLAFWQFQQPQHPVARRASSVSNVNDFSWRNRIAAWEGTLQMMAEKPWFGFGWNQPQPLYDHYYHAPKLNEYGAIGMNDYLTLGTTLGVPALICFGMYIWLSLMRSAECGVRNPR